jgi:transposase
MDNQYFVVAIDVAMDELCVAVNDRRTRTFAHTAEGVAALHRWALGQTAGAACWFVMESTGVYSSSLAYKLHVHHRATVSIVNPRRIRDHARAVGFRSKTDRQDALVILDYATRRQLHPWQPAPLALAQLGQLTAQLERLDRQWRAVRNWQHSQAWEPRLHPAVARCNRALAQHYQRQRQRLEQAIQALLETDTELQRQVELLKSIPSISDKSAWLLLGLTRGELAQRSPKQLTAFAGLAPAQHQSGTSVHKQSRIDRQGCARLRAALYMCCVSGVKFNPSLRAYYQRLKHREGSVLKGKQLMVAVMRKLLLIARAVLVSGQPYDAAYAAHQP